MKRFKALIVSALAALALAAYQAPIAQAADYMFEQVGPVVTHSDRASVAVRLVYNDGSPAPDARVYSVGSQLLLPKQGPSQKFTLLESDGHGAFTYESRGLRSGDTLRLAAWLESGGSVIYGSLKVH